MKHENISKTEHFNAFRKRTSMVKQTLHFSSFHCFCIIVVSSNAFQMNFFHSKICTIYIVDCVLIFRFTVFQLCRSEKTSLERAFS